MTQSILVNPEPCTGCLNCVSACAQRWSDSTVPEFAAIRVQLEPFTGIHTFTVCHQCPEAPCADTCSVHAITWNEQIKAWSIQKSLCNGCGTCVSACPYHAIFLSSHEPYPVKCDLCMGQPLCVSACKFGVLSIGNPESYKLSGIPVTDIDPSQGWR